MGDIFITIFKKITLFNSILMIIYCFFLPNLGGKFELMLIIMILLVVSWIIWLIGKFLNRFWKKKSPKEKVSKTNSILRTKYLKFEQYIDVSYSICITMCMIFRRQSISIDYLALLAFGLYLGNKIAVRANQYILDQASKKKKSK